MRASAHAGPERMIACPSLLQHPWMSPVPWGHLERLQGRVRARAPDGYFEKLLVYERNDLVSPLASPKIVELP